LDILDWFKSDVMKLAIMQPYFFPYIGFFQMINAVDKFIFLDDVNYIKGGWINRNRIVINGEASYITLQLSKLSQNKQINEIGIVNNIDKLKRSIELAYKKAPYFSSAWPVIEKSLDYDTENASELIIRCAIDMAKYLGINTEIEVSSKKYAHTKGMEKSERIIAICNESNANEYINAIGGKALYDKEYFLSRGVNLYFIQSEPIVYKNNAAVFDPWLSIIDIVMWNSKDKVREYLNCYTLV
jgi:hypothetical protein